jgi:hypothetical protein
LADRFADELRRAFTPCRGTPPKRLSKRCRHLHEQRDFDIVAWRAHQHFLPRRLVAVRDFAALSTAPEISRPLALPPSILVGFQLSGFALGIVAFPFRARKNPPTDCSGRAGYGHEKSR